MRSSLIHVNPADPGLSPPLVIVQSLQRAHPSLSRVNRKAERWNPAKAHVLTGIELTLDRDEMCLVFDPAARLSGLPSGTANRLLPAGMVVRHIADGQERTLALWKRAVTGHSGDSIGLLLLAPDSGQADRMFAAEVFLSMNREHRSVRPLDEYLLGLERGDDWAIMLRAAVEEAGVRLGREIKAVHAVRSILIRNVGDPLAPSPDDLVTMADNAPLVTRSLMATQRIWTPSILDPMPPLDSNPFNGDLLGGIANVLERNPENARVWLSPSTVEEARVSERWTTNARLEQTRNRVNVVNRSPRSYVIAAQSAASAASQGILTGPEVRQRWVAAVFASALNRGLRSRLWTYPVPVLADLSTAVADPDD